MVMKSSMKKTTLREIKNSFGRWIAILAIVALGVGFYAGLMVTTPAMVQTGGEYINSHELYDLRLLSTLGFEKDAVSLFAEGEGIEAAEGAVSMDFLAVDAHEESRVFTAQTLLSHQNQLELVEGRLPKSADECVIDAGVPDISVGDVLRISGENEEDTADIFAAEEYTVVGRANSVAYVQYERGSSALGNGKVSGFVYLLPEGFDTDYYTEIFLRFGQDYEIYTDAYEAAVEAWKDWAEPLTEDAAIQRYDAILEEANEKLADAQAELDSEVAKAQAELDDAQKTIDDAEIELADAQVKIADGEQKLVDGRKELAEKKAQLEDSAAELADGRSQVEDGLAQIADGKQQLEAALAMAGMSGAAGGAEINGAAGTGDMAGQQALAGAAGQQAMAGQLAALNEQLAQLNAQEAALNEKLAQIEDGEAQIASGRRQIAKAQKEIEDGEKELEENKQKLADARKDLEEGKQDYAEGEEKLAEETAKAQKKIDDAKEELADIEEPDVYVLGRDTNIGYACFENDSTIVAGIAKVFPIFFFLVAALVCITTMSRMVEEQRTQIGVLKALGYSEGRIMGKYLFYSGSAAVTGGVLGFAAGAVVFPTVIWEAYKMMYDMGEITLLFDWKLALISLIVAMLCSMGTTWLTCRMELKSVAAELIRPKSPKSGKRILLEHVPFIWKRLSFLVKVSIRNVMRYKQRFFMMVLGVGGCTALLVTGFGIKDSIADVAAQQYGEIQKYEMSLTLKDAFSESAQPAVDAALENGAQSYAVVCEKAMDLTGSETTKSINVIIPQNMEEMADYVSLHTEDGEAILWPEKGEAVLNQEAADRCGVAVGDTVSLRNDDGEKLSVTITALCENFVYNYIYVNPETWAADNGAEPEYKSLYLLTGDGVDERELSEILLGCDAVSAVTVNQDFMDRIANMMSSLDYIVLLVTVCAGALAFVVIYNLTNINITERIREIATIKVLGFRPGETASYVFRENIVLTAIGALAGLGMGVWLHRFVMSQVKVDMISFDVRILPASYVNSFLLTFVFMIIVDVFMYIKLEKIDMAESLKSIE